MGVSTRWGQERRIEDRVYLYGVRQVKSVGVGADLFSNRERAIVLKV
jgi:hypothetical protein